jgi:gluconate 2-dehydrogenase gamma chain
VLERLIPTDATGPGAKEALVLRYIDRALAGQLAAFKDAYVAGLASLDAYSASTRGGPFTALPPEAQDAVLSEMEAGRATGFTPDAKSVFEMIRTNCLQGMFGDPAHGGNAGFAGWKLVRFPGPRLIIDARDQQLDVTPKSALRSAFTYPNFRKLDPKDS